VTQKVQAPVHVEQHKPVEVKVQTQNFAAVVDPFSSSGKSSSGTGNFDFGMKSSIATPNKSNNNNVKPSQHPHEDLKSIENSIKHTYSITGKDAPNLNNNSNNNTKERELTKRVHDLEEQNDHLQYENHQLKNENKALRDALDRAHIEKPKIAESPYNPLRTEHSPEKSHSPMVNKVNHFIEEHKPCKGSFVPENHDLIHHIDTHRERVACLKQKAHIYEDDHIQVGISSTVVRDPITHNNQAKFTLFFGAKNHGAVSNFSVNYDHDPKSIVVHPVPFKPDSYIKAGEQVKQVVTVTLADPKNWSVTCHGTANGYNYSFAVPLTPIKFMECKQTTAEEFNHKWKLRDIFVLRTIEFDADESLIKSIDDFKKYFPTAVEVSHDHSKKHKFGVVFDLDNPNGDYLLRVNILPNSKICFQLASYDNVQDRVATVLQTLVALFKAH